MIVTALTASQILHEALDELEGTSFYRQSLKLAVKKVQKELTATCDQHFEDVWDADQVAMTKALEGLSGISKELAHMDPARLALFGELLKDGSIEFIEPIQEA